MDVKYLVEAAWGWPDNNFDREHCNITDDVLKIETLRGRDYASQLTGRSSEGRLRATLRNEDELYSPNGGGDLTGKLTPNTPVQVSVGLKKTRSAADFVAADSRYLTSPDSTRNSRFFGWNDWNQDLIIWVDLHSLPTAGNTMGIVGKWQAGDLEWLLFVDNTAGTIRFKLSVRNIADTVTTTIAAGTFGTPVVDTLYMVHIYHSADDNEIGISVNDGAHNTAAHGGGVRDGTADFNIGQHTGGNYLDALVGPLAMFYGYPVAASGPGLTAAELTWFYNGGVGHHHTESGIEGEVLIGQFPVVWFELDEASGDRLEYGVGFILTEVGGTIGSADGLSLRVYRTLWSGSVDTLAPTMTNKHFPFVALKGIGDLARAARAETFIYPSVLYPTERPTGWWFFYIFGAVFGFHPDTGFFYMMDEGQTTTGTFYAETNNALELVRQMEDTEMGFLYEPATKLAWWQDFGEFGEWKHSTTTRSGFGTEYLFGFADRHHRWTAERALVSQATFSDSPGAGELSYTSIKQEDPLKGVYNQIQAAVNNFDIGSSAILWTLPGDNPTIGPGVTRTFTAEYPNASTGEVAAFVSEWDTPVVGADVTVTGVSDSDIAINVFKRPKQMTIMVTNNHAINYATLTLIQAQGIPISYGVQGIVSAQDDDSIAKYGLRTFKLPAKWLPNLNTAQDYADYVVSRYKDPNHVVTLQFVANKSEAHMEAAMSLNFGDRITVTANGPVGLGINEDFYVEGIHHRIDQGSMKHVTTFTLSAVAGEGAYWVLGESLLGIGTKLAY